MLTLFARLKKWFQRKPITTTLLVDDTGITFRRSDGVPPDFIRWDAINEIQTYKYDLYGWDEICVALHVGELWYELSEEHLGFIDAITAMQLRFPSIPEHWYFDVSHPAFATNQRVLWTRSPK